MNLFAKVSDTASPYIDSVVQGWSEGAGSTIRPAESHWHMVIVRHAGQVMPIIAGPLSTAGVVSWGGSAEILWIKFKLGMYMPHLPAKTLLDKETRLPDASSQSFWLHGSAWEFPRLDNVDTFVARLVHDGALVCDPVVASVLQGHRLNVAPRTLRHRFQHTTGLTQTQIYQIERAQRAAALLAQGVSILDTVSDTGYFDQPHLTRALKRWVGHTPAQLVQRRGP